MSDLGTLGGSESNANGINTAGQVVGWADGADGYYHAFRYSDGVMSKLGPAGWEQSAAYAINDPGQVVGEALLLNGNLFDFLDSNGTVTNLGTLGGNVGIANGVNASGQVIGSCYTAGNAASHAYLYSGGVMSDLGTLGGKDSWPWAINGSGQVVGSSYLADNTDYHAFLYSGGAMVDLNTLLDANSSGYTVTEATGITDNGLIAAYGTTPGNQIHAFLLTPNAGIAGTVTLQNFGGNVTKVPVVIQIRNPGTTTTIQTQTVTLNSAGAYQLVTTLAGTYDVSAKASHWLRKTVKSVALTGTGFASPA